MESSVMCRRSFSWNNASLSCLTSVISILMPSRRSTSPSLFSTRLARARIWRMPSFTAMRNSSLKGERDCNESRITFSACWRSSGNTHSYHTCQFGLICGGISYSSNIRLSQLKIFGFNSHSQMPIPPASLASVMRSISCWFTCSVRFSSLMSSIWAIK